MGILDTIKDIGQGVSDAFTPQNSAYTTATNIANSGGDKEGWDSVYAANRNLGPQYMTQYGIGADTRLAGIQQGMIDQSMSGATEARNIGLQAGSNAQYAGQTYGTQAAQIGQAANAALTNEGSMAMQEGYQGWNNAIGTQNQLGTAGNQALAIGGTGALQAQQYAGSIADTGKLGLQAAATGQSGLAKAADTLGAAGEQALTYGSQGATQINQAAANLGQYGQLGMQAGQYGQQVGTLGATNIQGASNLGVAAGQAGQEQGLLGAQNLRSTGAAAANYAGQAANQQDTYANAIQGTANTGQRSLSQLGEIQGKFGMGVASQGQQFLDQRGYQQQMGDANQARTSAQNAAGQLTGVEAQEGPSAAQAQLREGLNKAQSSNLAMARSGRGYGGSASSMMQAANQNAQAGQAAANQSAILRAQENAAYRQRQAANLGTAANVQLSAGQQAMAREGQLSQAQLAQQQANQAAYLQAQGLGANTLANQAQTEAQARQMALAGNQAAAQQSLAGSQLGFQGQQAAITAQQAAVQAALGGSQQGISGAGLGIEGQQAAANTAMQGAQLGMQGVGMGLTAEQARAQAAAQAAQTGLAGVGQNISAQQAAAQAIGQGATLGMQGANQAMTAQQAAAQTSLAGNAQYLQGAQQNIGALQAGGQLGLAGAGLAQQGIAQNIDATQAGAQQGLAGTLGGGQLSLAGTTQGGQLALQGNQQALQGVAQAGTLGMTAEQQRAANTQYSYGLTQGQIANMLQIAGMQAGLEVQNAGMQNQMIGGGIGAAAAMLPLLAMSDVNAKTDIVPLSARSGADPYGIDYGAGLAKDKDEKDKKKRQEQLAPFQAAIGGLGQSMQGGADMGVNPITGQPWIMSDERSKYGYTISDERAKSGAREMVDNLDPYAFRYKDPERHGQGVHYGIMAQDLERSAAGRSVVEQGPDGYKRVNTPKLTMLNAAGLAAQDDRLAELEQRIARMGRRAA